MSQRVVKKVMASEDTSLLGGMFESMLGTKDADVDIIKPKYIDVINRVKKINKILIQFSSFLTFRQLYPKMIPCLDEIKVFADTLKTTIYPNLDNNNENIDDEKYKNIDSKELNTLYKGLKENNTIKRLIEICSKLRIHHKAFDDMEKLDDTFVNREPGLSFVIFDFSTLDLKRIWADDKTSPQIKKYIMTILYKLYDNLINIYKTITSPDVDVDQFASVLITCLDNLKKQPELSRCKKALERINSSVDLFKNNFDSYYRQSVASANPNLIIENFIIDVSNEKGNGKGNNSTLTREFRILIMYIHKLGKQQNKTKDPKLAKLFSMLNTNMEIMEKKNNIKFDEKEHNDNSDNNENSENVESDEKSETIETYSE